ncbi:hypothetical protein [Hoeflea sp.]|uniref:hypothetical protein n=1 Tax=Hoeflea sp. TaxID=1940281 RepID=UPI003B028EAF
MRNLLLMTITLACTTFAVTAFAQVPTHAQQQAIRSSCVADYKANCSSVPTGGMDALVCLEQHEAKLSPACKSAVEAVDHSSASSAPAATTAAASAASEAKPAESSSEGTTAEAPKAEAATSAATTTSQASSAGRPAMSLRQEMRLAARSCARDYRVLCPNLPVGQGNILFCLKVHEQHLSRGCRTALEEAGEILQ